MAIILGKTARSWLGQAFLCCLSLVSAGAEGLTFGSRPKGDEPELLVEFLGTNAPVVVESGWVFIDYEYVPGPYRLQRIGQGILVNGILVNKMYPGSLPWTNKTVKAEAKRIEKPVLPDNISEKDVHYRGAALEYLQKKRNYLYSKYDYEVAKSKMIDVINSMPFTEKTELVVPDFLLVYHKSGEKNVAFYLGTANLRLSWEQRSPEHFQSGMDARFKMFFNRLNEPYGEAVFLSSSLKTKPGVQVARSLSRKLFREIMETVYGDMPEEDKVSALRNRRCGTRIFDSDESAAAFIRKCMESEALRVRSEM